MKLKALKLENVVVDNATTNLLRNVEANAHFSLRNFVADATNELRSFVTNRFVTNTRTSLENTIANNNAKFSLRNAMEISTNAFKDLMFNTSKKLISPLAKVSAVAMLLLGTANIDSAPYSNGVGDGLTPSTAWEISTIQDWNAFAWDVSQLPFNGGAGRYFKLMADIGSEAIPVETMVGSSTNPFRGRFDGGGHTITVRFSSSPIGLFARVRSLGGDTVVIKNLTVRGRINNEKYLKVYE